MERTTEDIERLLERWYDAATTDDEERELREWFRESGTLPAGLESARRMFAGFEALGAEKAGSEVLHPEADCPEEPAGTDGASCSKESFRLRRAAFWLSAAAVVAGIVIAAEYLSQPYAYINGRPVRDAETAMQTTMYLRQLSVFDRSVQTFENAIKPENNE